MREDRHPLNGTAWVEGRKPDRIACIRLETHELQIFADVIKGLI